MRRLRVVATALSVTLLGALAVVAAVHAEESRVLLEPAPGDLAELQLDGMVPLAIADGGKELVFLEQKTGMVHTFSESGERWEEAVQLVDERGMPFSLKSPGSIAVGDGKLALVDFWENRLFDLESGGAEAQSRELSFSADIVHTSRGWAVGLANMPHPDPDIKVFGRGAFDEDEIPRVVLLDDDLEVWRSGLLEEGLPKSGSIGIARRLKLAWDGQRLYAAELANYRIFVLGKDLRLRTTYQDPQHLFEEGIGARSEEDKKAFEKRLGEVVAQEGQRPTALEKPQVKVRAIAAEAFDYQSVILDIAWDPRGDRLLVLVAAGIHSRSATLDSVDTATGELRRFSLGFPAGAETQILSQVVAGHDYIWFRNLGGPGKAYRLDRMQLFERGEKLTLPEVSLF